MIHLVMADTDQVPDDGITAGSRTTPQNVPPMRQAAATARELLTRFAAQQWQVDPNSLAVQDGTITHETTSSATDIRRSVEVEGHRRRLRAACRVGYRR